MHPIHVRGARPEKDGRVTFEFGTVKNSELAKNPLAEITKVEEAKRADGILLTDGR